MEPRKHFVTKCFTASPFSPLLTPQSFFSPVIRCFSGAADSLWSLSRWVRCVQVTRHLTLRGFLLRGCDSASCCVILLTHLPVSFSVSRAVLHSQYRTAHDGHWTVWQKHLRFNTFLFYLQRRICGCLISIIGSNPLRYTSLLIKII